VTFRSTWVCDPVSSSDPLESLKFNARWSPLAGVPGALTLIMYRGTTRYVLGTLTHGGSGWEDDVLTSSTDPATSEPWAVSNLSPGFSLFVPRRGIGTYNDGSFTGGPPNTAEFTQGEEPFNDATYITHQQGNTDRSSGRFTPTWPYFGYPATLDALVFNVRASQHSSQPGGLGSTRNITFFTRLNGTDTDIGSVILLSDGVTAFKWRPFTFVSTTNPITGVAWKPSDFASNEFGYRAPTSAGLTIGVSQFYMTARWGGGSEFGFEYTPNGSNNVALSRFYVEARSAVGPTDGLHLHYENWRWCDICAHKVPYSQLRRPQPPHPKAGFIVCARCLDAPDHEMRMALRGPRTERETDPLY